MHDTERFVFFSGSKYYRNDIWGWPFKTCSCYLSETFIKLMCSLFLSVRHVLWSITSLICKKKKKKRKLCLCWTSGTAAMMQCSCCLLCEVWYTTTQKDLLPNSLLMKNCAKTCISISSHAQRLEQHQTTQSHKYCITKVSLKSMNSHPFRDSLTAVYLTLLWVTDKFSHRILYIWNWIKYW